MAALFSSYFNLITLSRLDALPVGVSINFEKFADRLIEEAGLNWHSQSQEFAQMPLYGAINRMVLMILQDFGALKCEYEEKPLGKSTKQKLVGFKINRFGKELLASLKMMSLGSF